MVERLLTDKDGATRPAEVRTARGVTNRPINKLYSLEVRAAIKSLPGAASTGESLHEAVNAVESLSDAVTVSATRAKRKSAQKALKVFKDIAADNIVH